MKSTTSVKCNRNEELKNKISPIDMHIVNVGGIGRLRKVAKINNINSRTVPKCTSGTMQVMIANCNHFLSKKKRKLRNITDNAQYHLIKFSALNAEKAIIRGKKILNSPE